VARNVEVLAQPTGAERRTSVRVDLEIEVGLETDSNFYTGLTQDISTGGLFVATHRLRPIGERLVLKFGLPNTQGAIVVEGEVRWLREAGAHTDAPSGMGLKFLNLSAQARMAIASFLKKRESLFYDDE
jgi:uncharacterized protein (TIGR02266 family)